MTAVHFNAIGERRATDAGFGLGTGLTAAAIDFARRAHELFPAERWRAVSIFDC
jgi:hypothetical protein